MGGSMVSRRRLALSLVAALVVSAVTVPLGLPLPGARTDIAAAAEGDPPAVYGIVDLGAPAGSFAFGINDGGSVVGGLPGGGGFVFRDDELTDLGAGTATAVSEYGEVFGPGHGTGAGGRAMASTPDGSLAAGASFHPGVIPAEYGTGISVPDVWSSGTGWRDIYSHGCQLPTMVGGMAFGINAAGTLVGQALLDPNGGFPYSAAGTALACRPDTSNPGIYVATNLAPTGGPSAGAFAINASGTVVGKAQTGGSGPIEATIWPNASPLDYRPLGTFADGHDPGDLISHSAAYGINDAGVVVGTYGQTAVNPLLQAGAPTNRAFIWSSSSGMRDLTDLLPADSGWTLHAAFDINSSGQIVGQGTFSDELHAFLMTPITDVNITADRIVVTQAIQNERNLDLLVAGKPSYAIVRAHSDTRDVTGVTARLSAYRNGQLLGTVQPVGPPVTIRPEPDLDKIEQSFVFALRPSWTAAGTLTLQAKVNPGFDVEESDYTDNQTPRTSVLLKPSPPLSIVVVDAYYKGQPAPSPDRAAFRALAAALRRLMPTGDVRIRHHPVPVAIDMLENTEWTDKCGMVVTALASVRRSMNLGPQTLLYGQMAPKPPDGRSPWSFVDDNGDLQDAGVAGCSFVPDMVAAGWTGPGAAIVGVHELIHAMGRNHVPFCGAVGQDAPAYPATAAEEGRVYAGSLYQGVYPLPDGADLAFDGTRLLPFTSAHDVMTYCGLGWPSDYTYENTYKLIPDIGTRPSNSLARAVSIVGQIDELNRAADVSLTEYEPESPTPGPIPGPYHIEFYEGATKLGDVPFTPAPMGPHQVDGGEPRLALINETVAMPAGTDRIAIYDDRARRELSSTPVGGNAPTISMSAPGPAASLPGSGTVTVTWSSDDADGDALTHTVLYRPAPDERWTVLANDVDGTSAAIDAAALAGSSDGTLRVVAHDGFHTATDDVTGLGVPDKPPVVTIGAPSDGTVITTEQALELSGSAQPLAGTLEDPAYEWSSDLDGALGTGSMVVADQLSVGTHEVELRVTTPEGEAATATTTVVVVPAGQTPSALALSYDRLHFTGDATAPEPAPQSFEVYDPSGGHIDWTATTSDPRVILSTTAGATPSTVEVSVDTGALHAGESLSATVTIRRADGTQDPVTVEVHAESARGTEEIWPLSVDFDGQAVGSTGPPHDVTFTYNGAGTMTLGQVTLAGAAPGEFTTTTDGCSNTALTSGASCTVVVSFQPTSVGRRTAYLVFADGDSHARWYAELAGLAAYSFTSSVVAWGSSEYGQAGPAATAVCDPDPNNWFSRACSSAPVTVPGLTDVVQVASEGTHNLALKTDGTVLAWGSNERGELGNGTSTPKVSSPIPHPVPEQVAGLTAVVAVATALNASLALRADGTVWEWGRLGPSTFGTNTTPSQVRGVGNIGYLTDVIAIAAASTNGYALRADGTVVAWGRNDYGQLGNGTISNNPSPPTQVVGPGGQGLLTNVVAIADRMALRADGTVWTWGPNGNGELGAYNYPTVTFYTNATTPVQVLTGTSTAGAPLTGITAIRADTASPTSSTFAGNARFALDGSGRIWAWGARPADIGVLNLNNGVWAQQVRAPGGLGSIGGVTMMGEGSAVTSDGAVWGWGNNLWGQVGNGTLSTSPPESPQRVLGVGGTGVLGDVQALAGGLDHRTAIVGSTTGPPTTLTAGAPVTVTAAAGETLNATIGSFDDSGPSQAFDFSAFVDWGDGTADSAVKVTGPDGGPYEIGGTHTYREPGMYELTIDVVGRGGDAVTITGRVTVTAATLTALPSADVTFVAGAPAKLALGAFESSNPFDNAGSFTATVDWGDGSTPGAALVEGPPGGPFAVVGEHTYSRAGTYPLHLEIAGDGAPLALLADAVVGPASLTVGATFSTALEDGTVFSGPLALFLDGNPLAVAQDYSAVVDWGDGITTAGTVSGPAGGPWVVGGSHTYATAAPFTVTVSIHGPAVASATASTTLLSPRQHLSLTASATPSSGPVPLESVFTYVVRNDGTDRLWSLSVSGTVCGDATYASGDDGNGVLDPGESWMFACSHRFDDNGTFTDASWASAYELMGAMPVRSGTVETSLDAGDTTPPIVTVTGVTDGATYAAGSVPAAGCNTIDPEPSSGIASQATPLTTGGPTEYTVTCSGATDVAGNPGNTAVAHYTVRTADYAFSGFKPPVDNLPTVNRVKAGAAVPVKFSLGGDHGLDIFASGSPRSGQVTCGASSDVDNVEQTVTAGSSNLTYDQSSDTYTYVWKTAATWKNACRQLLLTFADGSTARADFVFTR